MWRVFWNVYYLGVARFRLNVFAVDIAIVKYSISTSLVLIDLYGVNIIAILIF